MVISFRKIFPWIILFVCFAFPSACSNDLLGLLASSDLDERLKETGNFEFLNKISGSQNPVLGDEYSFIVITDTHIENGNAHGFDKIKDVISSNNNIKFVVVVGDITQNGRREDVKKFVDIAEELVVPCYPVIGNHDVYFNNWSNWRDLIGSTRYRIDSDCGKTTLFFLDSANSFFGKSQLDWLDRELKTRGDRVFVFTHINLFVDTPYRLLQLTSTNERARLISLLKNRCDIMFMGHVHNTIIREAGGVQYLSIIDLKSSGTYCLVSVNNNGVEYSFRKLP